jgi:DNA-directed RNA polymerase subunit M/transcription elongation factor TFIIS
MAVNQPAQKKVANPTGCPNCGAVLHLNKERDLVSCAYCGYEALPDEAVRFKNEIKSKIERLFNLARTAYEGNNCESSYQYFAQVLEEDAENMRAWVGKGCSALYLSTIDSPRFAEFYACVNAAFTSPKDDPEWMDEAAQRRQFAAETLTHITIWYAKGIVDDLSRKFRGYANMPSSSASITDGAVATIQNFKLLKALRETFTNIYAPNIVQSIKYAWWLHQSELIAERIYIVINTVEKSNMLSKKIKQSFAESVNETRLYIKKKFPNWTPPQAGKK